MAVRSFSQSRFPLRASAVLTNGAVTSAVLSVPQTHSQKIGIAIDFTLGSLTNGIFTAQVFDGTTWYDVTSPAALTMTADGHKFFVVDCTGMKQFRMSVIGTDTVTNSLAAIWGSWQIG